MPETDDDLRVIEPTTLTPLRFKLPKKTRDRFKAWCATRGMSMGERLRAHVYADLKVDEQK